MKSTDRPSWTTRLRNTIDLPVAALLAGWIGGMLFMGGAQQGSWLVVLVAFAVVGVGAWCVVQIPDDQARS